MTEHDSKENQVVSTDEVENLKKQINEIDAERRAILETIADGVITIDDTGKILSVNHAILDMFGHKPEDLINQSILILIDPNKQESYQIYLNKHLKHQESTPFNDVRELQLLKKNGLKIPVYVTISENTYSQEKRFTCIFRDMSAQREANQKMLTAENHLSWAVEALKDGFVIFNEADELVLCNKHYKNRHKGFEDLIVPGVTFSEILQAALDHKLFKGAIGNEETYFKARHAQHRNPSGPIEQRLSDGNVICLIEQKTRNGYTIGLTIDISDLKKKDRALEKSENQLRKTIDAAMDAVIVIDQHGKFIDYNEGAESTFGFSRQEVIGKLMAEMIIPEHARADHYKGFNLYINTGNHKILGKRLELDALHADGTEFPIELSIQAAETPDGPIFVGFARDITEKKAAEDALIEAKERAELASQSQNNFLAMMSHEIRTPLNGILGIMTLLEESDLSDEQKKLLNTSQKSGESLLAIINDVLDYSKIEAGEYDLRPSEFSLEEFINDSTDIIRQRAEEKKLTFRIHIEGQTNKNLWGDVDRLRQVLTNLCSNAVKFTDEGFITIRCQLEPQLDNRVKLSMFVVDTGIGIPQDKMGELFQKFKTVDPTYQRKEGGTGLGLAISKQIINSMEGNIGVKANDLGGSTFWFQVTLDQVEKNQSIKNDQASLADLSTMKDPETPYHLLIAEDNATNALVASSMLKKAGYTIDIVENGAEAVEAVKRFDYDLVLMDIGMPVLDGTAATAEIRKLYGHKSDIPIIALTAHVLKDKRMANMLVGMDDYLSKPINKTEMLKLINEWVTGKKSHAKTKQTAAEKLLSPPPQQKPVRKPQPKLTNTSVNEKVTTAESNTGEDLKKEEETAFSNAPFGNEKIINKQTLAQLGKDTDPSLMPTLIEDFLKNANKRLASLEAALEDKNETELDHHAHALGSSAATFGADRLKTLLRSIEAACQDNDCENAFALAKYIDELSTQTSKALHAYIEKEEYKSIEQVAT